MTYRSIRDLGLDPRQSKHIMKILRDSKIDSGQSMGKSQSGGWIKIISYNTNEAMRVLRSKLDYDCMELTRLYDEYWAK